MYIQYLKRASAYIKAIWNTSFYIFLVMAFTSLSSFVFFLSVLVGGWGELPSTEELTEIQHDEASVVYAADHEILGQYHFQNRREVNFRKLPPHLIDALVATEDVRFYDHEGVDVFSLSRVFFKSILLGDKSAGGGSTISQQLVKNLYPRENHGPFTMAVNKTKEMILAMRMEDIYSKKEILTLYLNTVPFGDNTYGIESASQRFFSKSVEDITLEESATLVGMLKATHYYNPRVNPENAISRRNTVFYQMMKYGFIGREWYDSLSQSPIELNLSSFDTNAGIATYFRAEVKKQVKEWLEAYNYANGTNYNIYTSGLKIHTTLDYNMQLMAENAIAEHMTELQETYDKYFDNRLLSLKNKHFKQLVKNSKEFRTLKEEGLSDKEVFAELAKTQPLELWDWQGSKEIEASLIDKIAHYQRLLNTGMISIDPKNGAVKAWVGGINYAHYKFDHVSQSKRQVGSTFKPFVYASALEQGASACNYYNPQSVKYASYENWAALNSDEEQNRFYTMKGALANSVNTVAVKVMQEAGINNVVNLANQAGLENVPRVPSIALGTAEINMLSLAQAYTIFLNDGKAAHPTLIQRIEDKEGNVLVEFSPKVSNKPVISKTTQETMIEMMKGVVNEGTGSRIRWKYNLTNDIAGKTGTTQNNKDGWFVGLTPNLVTITWVGPDNYRLGFKSTRLGQGANTALPIFALFQKKMNSDSQFNYYTKAKFSTPSPFTLEELGCPAESSWKYLEPAEPKKTEPFKQTLRMSLNNPGSQISIEKPRMIQVNVKSSAGQPSNK
ncbi:MULTISPECIES: PBP1A family penicillin-binding protein [Roseivirga]|mgnify:FL=1|uniref:PBP1A family penicillin-binding protein n=1 Tax=Roseivirga TaxID=290180 RepID=UPI001B05673B|nr:MULTISPECIES: PBP1A family penicillin-binding protein [Roseivirga]MBO6660603.1 PBP1A family penicillin-binding protein [Roseivirga sp.]MBO6759387.1 PBP1A family penicillin-binding protein [Roseivirga sp.]MBO6906660.1 PBP1A family penicillin-binding protein [Roseivirga sp.]WPZ09070.1 PBP1A family penicillin-binding protein [Roseivirga spongicola]